MREQLSGLGLHAVEIRARSLPDPMDRSLAVTRGVLKASDRELYYFVDHPHQSVLLIKASDSPAKREEAEFLWDDLAPMNATVAPAPTPGIEPIPQQAELPQDPAQRLELLAKSMSSLNAAATPYIPQFQREFLRDLGYSEQDIDSGLIEMTPSHHVRCNERLQRSLRERLQDLEGTRGR